MMPARFWAPLLGSWKRVPSPRTKEGEGLLQVLTQQSCSVARLTKALGEQEDQVSEELCVRRAGPSFHGQLQFMISRNRSFSIYLCFVLFESCYADQSASVVVSRELENLSPFLFTLFIKPELAGNAFSLLKFEHFL